MYRYVGDPNDKSLRKVELEVCIPGIIRERAHREKCHDLINGEIDCIRENQKHFLCLILMQNLVNVVNNMVHGLSSNAEKKSKQ